jgi:predicted nucleic acid-binding protein
LSATAKRTAGLDRRNRAVSDTTPLNYLVLIEAIDVLPQMYGRVLIPAAVWDELSQPGTPKPVLKWMAQCPSWLEVTNPRSSPDPTMSHLDEGEANAITLAWNAAPICFYSMSAMELRSLVRWA